MICETCSQEVTQTCFAFCQVDPEVCEVQKVVDMATWQEMYAAVRCMRDRRDPKLSGKTGADREAHTQRIFPGFCRQHNQLHEGFVDRYWRQLPRHHQLLLNYMIDGSRCALVHLDTFLAEHRQLYGSTTVYDIMHLLLTPASLMAVDTVYLQSFLEIVIDRQHAQAMISQAEVMHALQRPDVTWEQAQACVRAWESRFQTERHNYQFLVDGILQAATLSWLMSEDPCQRMLHWNLLFFKVSIALQFSFVPPEVRNSLPGFHQSWKKVWNQSASSACAALPDSNAQTIFQFHWKDFMMNMEALVVTIDELLQTQAYDALPDLDISQVLTQWSDCQK